MSAIQVVQTTQQIIVNPLIDAAVVVTQTTQPINILPSTNAVTVVNAGPVGPMGPTAIHVGPTPPSNTALLWVQTL